MTSAVPVPARARLSTGLGERRQAHSVQVIDRKVQALADAARRVSASFQEWRLGPRFGGVTSALVVESIRAGFASMFCDDYGHGPGA
jgi:hypothetical protein